MVRFVLLGGQGQKEKAVLRVLLVRKNDGTECTLVSSNRRMPTTVWTQAGHSHRAQRHGERFCRAADGVTRSFEFHALSLVLNQFLITNPLGLGPDHSNGRSSSFLPCPLRLLAEGGCFQGAQCRHFL